VWRLRIPDFGSRIGDGGCTAVTEGRCQADRAAGNGGAGVAQLAVTAVRGHQAERHQQAKEAGRQSRRGDRPQGPASCLAGMTECCSRNDSSLTVTNYRNG
jgi:hypothetical protein